MPFDSTEKINKLKFNELLDSIAGISYSERKYLEKVFGKDLERGLTRVEFKEKIRKLQYTTEDDIDQWELRKVKSKLLEKLGD